MATKLSVAIIAHNEAHNSPHCLRSVAWADEVVVVDNGSTDGSQRIVVDFGARLIETPDWPGFGPQKNRALDAFGAGMERKQPLASARIEGANGTLRAQNRSCLFVPNFVLLCSSTAFFHPA